jgi:serine/threonine protein kinase
VKLLEAKFELWPRLTFENAPFGTLQDQEILSDEECVMVLRQGMSALVHLQEREQSIVHRHIKPGNILI